MENSKKFI